jgi:hypothetical protein
MALGAFANRPFVRNLTTVFLAVAAFPFTAHAAGPKQVAVWLTTRDKSSLLAEQPQPLSFAPPGSIRIASPAASDAPPHVAFLTPEKRHILIVSNPTEIESSFLIRFNGKDAQASLPAGAVGTYVW